MSEIDFDRRLERLFAETPELPDGAQFAAGIERALSRGWTARRWLIGAAGVVGGVIGAGQLFASGLFARVESAGQSARVLSEGLAQVTSGADMVSALSGGLGPWIAGGLAILTLAFALSRVIEEI